jgi:hypothetical protein
MKKVAHLIVFTLVANLSLSFGDTQYFGNEPNTPKEVSKIGYDHNFRMGFGIRNFNLDYAFSFNFFNAFNLGVGTGLKTLKAPIFTTLGLQKEPEIRMVHFPFYLYGSANIYRNGNFNVYAYGMFGRTFFTETEHNTPDKSLKSMYAELGIGVRWSSYGESFGLELGQFYTNARGTGRFDYLGSPASADYDLEIYNIVFNITFIRYF